MRRARGPPGELDDFDDDELQQHADAIDEEYEEIEMRPFFDYDDSGRFTPRAPCATLALPRAATGREAVNKGFTQAQLDGLGKTALKLGCPKNTCTTAPPPTGTKCDKGGCIAI